MEGRTIGKKINENIPAKENSAPVLWARVILRYAFRIEDATHKHV